MGETVRKVKHSSVTISNPLSALDRGTEYFSLARTFRTAWGGSGGETITNIFIEKYLGGGRSALALTLIFGLEVWWCVLFAGLFVWAVEAG